MATYHNRSNARQRVAMIGQQREATSIPPPQSVPCKCGKCGLMATSARPCGKRRVWAIGCPTYKQMRLDTRRADERQRYKERAALSRRADDGLSTSERRKEARRAYDREYARKLADKERARIHGNRAIGRKFCQTCFGNPREQPCCPECLKPYEALRPKDELWIRRVRAECYTTDRRIGGEPR